jgi:DNA modification methylase
MAAQPLKVNRIIKGDCLDKMLDLPDNSVDLIFADPPYNLQLKQKLWRPNQTLVNAVDDDWDQFRDFTSYDEFSYAWLKQCRRLLKEQGTIWVIGSYHNIFRLGKIMQDIGFWLLNDVIWVKTNPMPNFRGVRFTNAHETLIWASRQQQSKYTFNYRAMKNLNGDLQMRSDWLIPLCTGPERLKINGKKAHSTQKPEALLFRIIVSSSNPGDIVLDPFFGTGTTGVVAKRMGRNWIGIERDENYVELAQNRIDSLQPGDFDPDIYDVRDKKRNQKRVPFGRLVESGLLLPGQSLFYNQDLSIEAKIVSDGTLIYSQHTGSIHQIARMIADDKPSNGWQSWYYKDQDGYLHQIDHLRSIYIEQQQIDDQEN